MIRRLVDSDLDAAAGLERQCFQPPWSRSALASELARPGSLCLGCEADDGALQATGVQTAGALVAMAFFLTVAGEAELLRLAVHPSCRGQGIGRRLLRAGLSQLHDLGVETCHLEVEAGNEAAIALYKSAGFEVVGKRAGYYANGMDALLFRYSPAIIPPRSGRSESGNTRC